MAEIPSKTIESKDIKPKEVKDQKKNELKEANNFLKSKFNEFHEPKFYSDYKERIDHTPINREDRGYWTGDRGESKFIPTDKKIIGMIEGNRLRIFGLKGIEYKDGVPNFRPVAKEIVQIDNMSERRTGENGNYDQAFTKIAEKWNNKNFEGRKDWDSGEVAKWCKENHYTCHEESDRKTCLLVPTDVHDFFRHTGGCCECSIRDGNKNGVKFDD